MTSEPAGLGILFWSVMEKQLRTRSGCLGIQNTELQSPPSADKKLRHPQRIPAWGGWECPHF